MAKTAKRDREDDGRRTPGVPKLSKVQYETELVRLQADLVALQEWVKQTGRRVVIVFEGRDAAGKGSTIKRVTEYLNPRVARIAALPMPTERETHPVVLPALHPAPAGRRRDRAVRPVLVQPGRGRTGHGLLHARGVPALPPPVPDVRADARRGRHPPAQVLVLGERRGAGATVPLAAGGPAATVEVLPQRPAHPRQVGRVLPGQGRDVRPHRPPRGAVVRRRGRDQASRQAEHDLPPAQRSLPSEPVEVPVVKLPPRPPAKDYERPPRELFRAVPDYAAELLATRG